MKIIKNFLVIMFFVSIGFSQADYSPIPLYWKTLDKKDKEIYLFAYLTQVYDTHKFLIDDVGRGGFSKYYYEERAELAYNIFDLLDSTPMSKFIIWIDDFYAQPELREFPFPEALKYAYKRSQIKEEDKLLEKFRNNLLDD
tara:strand:+ start:2980 stop:3402 length:423 start_codon:yes stop_codon:yes gene_type:complete